MTSPPVTSPPRNPYRSISSVRAPCRAAETAAATPANPPPQTRTSVSFPTGVFRSGSRTQLIDNPSSFNFPGAKVRATRPYPMTAVAWISIRKSG